VLVVIFLVIRYVMQQSAVTASPTGGASSFLSTLSPGPGQSGTTTSNLGG